MLPTLAELTGVTEGVPDDLDGLSFLPSMLGREEEQEPHEDLYWAFYERGGAQALRMGRWKAVQQPIHEPVRLYDLAADLAEERDVAGAHPEIVAEMSARMKTAYTPSELWKFPERKKKR